MSILYFLESIRNPVMDALLAAITYFGSEIAFIAGALIVYWCFSKKYGYYLMATAMLGTVVNQFLKILFRVPRPWVRDPDFTIVESARAAATGYSFPSGHTSNAVCIFGGIARSAKRTAVRVVCIVIAALVALSRMYLGVHYPTDVGVGLLCAVVFVFALYPIFQNSDGSPRGMLILFGVTAVLTYAAALFVQLHAWPADVDAANLDSSVKTLYMMFGCTAALLIAIPIERRYIRFDTSAPWWAQILKVVVGLGLLMGLRVGLKPLLAALLGTRYIAGAIRYALLVLFATIVWPLTFAWFSRGCRRARKQDSAEG